MHDALSEALGLRYPPVALLWAEEKPEGALEFVPGRWGCVVNLFAQAAVRGRTAAFRRETAGCNGGAVGLGFGNRYESWPGGIDAFCRFLSTGNEGVAGMEEATATARRTLRAESLEHYLHGERYVKSPELVRGFVDSLPMRDIPARYVLFRPLSEVDTERETPVSVTLLADPDQISALVYLANYGREGLESVACPMGAGCQSIGIHGYREAEREAPRGVIGLFDLSARLNVAGILPPDVLSFTAAWSLFQEMTANVPGSFLEMRTWKELREKRAAAARRAHSN